MKKCDEINHMKQKNVRSPPKKKVEKNLENIKGKILKRGTDVVMKEE